AAPAPPPRLLVEASTTHPVQGGIVVLAVASDRPLAALAARLGGTVVPLEAAGPGDGTRFRGLLGIDLDSPVGRQWVSFEAAAADGGTHVVRYPLRIRSGRFRVQRLDVDARFVELPPAILERVRQEQAAVAAVWAGGERERRWAGAFRPPVGVEPVANFGVRRVFNGQPRSPHNGVDFPAPEGTPVVAPAAGRVALAAELYFSGGTVILDHGAGLFTTYFHLSRIAVAAGELVEPGRLLGAVGATGRATGPHLHWGARLAGARVNPLELLTLPDWPPPS
ncbi:MAG TPA: M23 family metallopeptidase, partial [Thermodesulfobacteriota bacterium]|nr:M23 family metallopeptidase [Thermodesulfobacteriota bacterium]